MIPDCLLEFKNSLIKMECSSITIQKIKNNSIMKTLTLALIL